MSGISLIIPTYNRAGFLRETLCSIAAMNCPPHIEREVLVINNNCTDETEQVVSEAMRAFPCALRHIDERQQGLCFGRNRGITEAAHEHLAFLDDDIRVSPDWIPSYFEAVLDFEADAVAGPVYPLFAQPKPEFLVGRALEIISSGYSRKGPEIQILPQNLGHELPGCNFGVRKSVAQAIGGFDNSLDRIGKGLLAGGDSDFGRRLVAAGKRTVYHPGCSIEHLIIPEKMTKPYLRRRAFGLGATSRVIRANGKVPVLSRCRQLASVGRMSMGILACYLLGQKERGFDRELRALQRLGFAVTNPPRGLSGIPTQALLCGTAEPEHDAASGLLHD